MTAGSTLHAAALLLLLTSCSPREDLRIDVAPYPDGKDFAFTIIDDPDYGDLAGTVLVHDYLDSIGMKTTVPVWVMDQRHGSGEKGSATNSRGITAANRTYRAYLQLLQRKGFEICLHTASPGNDYREETIRGYELFKHYFGSYPKINTNHANNIENIYWGADRFSDPIIRYFARLFEPKFEGHKNGSPYFWGDISRERTKYIRGWATDDINTLSSNVSMPFRDKDTAYVNYWFSCSDGYNYGKFMRLISDEHIKELAAERGASIVYTHFAYGFVDKAERRLHPAFRQQMAKIARMNGWFMPASVILDRLLLLKQVKVLSEDGDRVVIANSGSEPVPGFTVLANTGRLYICNRKAWVVPDASGKLPLGTLAPYGVVRISRSGVCETNEAPGTAERIAIGWNWLKGRINQ